MRSQPSSHPLSLTSHPAEAKDIAAALAIKLDRWPTVQRCVQG
jgi:hypothetical protein